MNVKLKVLTTSVLFFIGGQVVMAQKSKKDTVETKSIDEVVVTALGIKRSEKSLGYSVSTIKAKELNEVRSVNAIAALQGKTSGVQILPQSGNLGSSTKVLIRGISSLQGDQQPLWVIDGVPISNAQIATGSRIQGSFDFGNRAQDINPDDIETINILKGSSAAALYGSRAANGVILITTKKGKKGRKASFEYTSTTRFDTPLVLPEFQNTYVNGDRGTFVTNLNTPINATGGFGTSGWGPNIDVAKDKQYVDYTGNKVPFKIYQDNVKDFYRMGVTSVNSFAASGGTDKSDYRIGLSYTNQLGVIPNQRLNRTNLNVNAGSEFTDKLRSRINFNYIRTNLVGSAAAGANDPNVLTSIINSLPRNADISLFKNYINDAGQQLNRVGTQTNNPYWIAYMNNPENSTERFLGNVQLEFEPLKDLVFLGRAGYDSYFDKRFRKNAIGTLGRLSGNFVDDYISNREVTLDLLASYKWGVGERWNFSTNAGTQWNQRALDRLLNTADQLTVPNLYAPGNAKVNTVEKAFSDRRIVGVFGDLTVDYANWFFLNMTARNDWSSTLPVKNRSFFYPSVAASVVFTDALKINSNILNYGKIRAAWANVGVDTGAYLLDYTYNPLTSYFGQYGTGGTYPFDGKLAFNSSGSVTNPDLKAENKNNLEFGLELGLLKNRVSVDFTYYNNKTENQIISLPTATSTGFGSLLTNLGQVSNKGIELQLNLKIIKTRNFSWDLNYNFTKNKFIVDDLGGLKELTLANEFNGLSIRAVQGDGLIFYGTKWKRALDSNGNNIDDKILVNSRGLREAGQVGKLGNIFPDYLMGITSTFTYKNISLSTTFDYRKGGAIFSNTVGQLRRDGLAVETAVNNRVDFIDPNTFQLVGGQLIANGTKVSPQDYWNAYASANIAEGQIFDGTFLMWRELSLSYSLPSSLLEGTFVKGLKAGVQARNLGLFLTKVPHVSPEASLGGASSNLQGIERGGVPDVRSVGFNIIMNF